MTTGNIALEMKDRLFYFENWSDFEFFFLSTVILGKIEKMLVFHCELLQLAIFTASLVRVFSPFYFAEVNLVTSSFLHDQFTFFILSYSVAVTVDFQS